MWKRKDYPLRYSPPVRIAIEDGVVSSIDLNVNEDVDLQRTLATFRTPDEIRISFGDYGIVSLRLIYLNELVSISLSEHYEQGCRLKSIGKDLWVKEVHFYSPQDALQPTQTFIHGRISSDLVPTLLAYSYTEWHVSPETWDNWLNGKVDTSCFVATKELPDDPVFPALPAWAVATATPSP